MAQRPLLTPRVRHLSDGEVTLAGRVRDVAASEVAQCYAYVLNMVLDRERARAGNSMRELVHVL